MGFSGSDGFRAAYQARDVVRGCADRVKLGVRGALPFMIEQYDEVQVGELRQFPNRLIHEYTAAVDGRANRVRRDEEYVEPVRARGEFLECIAEVGAKRTAERFAVRDGGQGLGAATRGDR